MSKIPGSISIPGKLTLDEAVELAKLAKDRNVVQLGAYCGRATIALAQVARRLWVLDDFRCPGGIDTIAEELKRNVKEAGVNGKISLLYGTGERFTAFNDPPTEVTMVYRDANRMPEYEEGDQLFALNALGNGGIYAWHEKSLGVLKWLELIEKEKSIQDLRDAYELSEVLESK